jgi:hypothetical protein
LTLLQDLLYLTLGKDVDVEMHLELDLSTCPGHVLFAVTLYHRWVLRAVMYSRLATKQTRQPYIPVWVKGFIFIILIVILYSRVTVFISYLWLMHVGCFCISVFKCEWRNMHCSALYCYWLHTYFMHYYYILDECWCVLDVFKFCFRHEWCNMHWSTLYCCSLYPYVMHFIVHWMNFLHGCLIFVMIVYQCYFI